MEEKSKVLQYGMIWSIISIISGILIYLSGTAFFKNFWYLIILMIVSMIIGIVIMTLSAQSERKRLGGFINLQNAFRAAFIPAVIVTIVSLLFNLTLYKVIDPGYPAEIKEAVLDMTEDMMEKFGADEDTIESSIEETEKRMEKKDQFGFKGLLKQAINGILLNGVLALIIGAIIKRKDPELA